MKTYLQLCQAVCRECSIAAGESAITTVANQSGQLQRVTAAVRDEWTRIQNLHTDSGLLWRFLRSEFTLLAETGVDTYASGASQVKDTVAGTPGATITRFRKWLIANYDNPPKSYKTSAGKGTEGFLTFLAWNDFKYIYDIGTQNPGPPAHITINPQNKLVIGPVPDSNYTITGDYIKSAQLLVLDDDEPDMPVDMEDVIVWKAVSRTGLQKNAGELITLGEDNYAHYLGQLESDQLSEIPIASPMA